MLDLSSLSYLPYLHYALAGLSILLLTAFAFQNKRLRRQEVRIRVLVHQSKQQVKALQNSQKEVRSLERQLRDLSERLSHDANQRRRTEARLRQMMLREDEIYEIRASANQSGFSETIPMSLQELYKRA